ncbi:uncharacterized protein LOC124312190 isoform X2 [Daphnia pulicaria]|uniref:uncharacterized protein LOC124312190 isoform X2 n=1 Tax=Daphnia pulicaria TaxID=35523 RepID=UPI001EEBBD41|nr:uncharacterized protein LOC124312190 isoform X2 [Daphnia pulicaria]
MTWQCRIGQRIPFVLHCRPVVLLFELLVIHHHASEHLPRNLLLLVDAFSPRYYRHCILSTEREKYGRQPPVHIISHDQRVFYSCDDTPWYLPPLSIVTATARSLFIKIPHFSSF